MKNLLFLLLISFSFTNCMENQSIQRIKHQKEQPQFKRVLDYLEKLEVQNYKQIIHLSSGPGDITADIAQRAPNSKVLGIELDENNNSYAHEKWKNISNLSFVKSNPATFSEKKANLVLSFLAFHWVNYDQQQEIMKNICQHLEDNGELHLIMLAKSDEDAPQKVAIENVWKSAKWKSHFEHSEQITYSQTKEELEQLILKSEFRKSSVEEKARVVSFSKEEGKKMLSNFIHRFPRVADLTQEKQTELVNDVINELHRLTSNEENNITATSKFLFAQATK